FEQHRHQSAFRLLDEGHLVFGVDIDANEVTQLDLPGGYQVGKREHDEALNGALRVAGSILPIRALDEQKALHFGCTAKNKLTVAGSLQDALLHHAQLDFQNLLEVFGAQHLEDHSLIDAVHELGREFSARCFHCRTSDFFVEPRIEMR